MAGAMTAHRPDDAHGLVKYNAARRALDEACRVDEVKEIRDRWLALTIYAKQAKDSDLISKATDLKIRAERRVGEMLKAMGERGERAAPSDTLARGNVARPRESPSLADLGFSKTQSSRWQKLADLNDDDFETRLAAAKREAVASVESPRAERIREKQERRAQLERELGAKLRALPDEKFGVILADPEWRFTVWGGAASGMLRIADNHYATRSDQGARRSVNRGRRLRALSVGNGSNAPAMP
jgi:hypothetical protein